MSLETPAISEPLKALLGLFETEFTEVKFPDVDVQVLAASARGVMSAAERVAQAKAALEQAEAALAEEQEALLHKGHRALAYARIFAEESPELMEKLQLISLPRTAAARRARVDLPATAIDGAPVKRRGRPPKQKTEAPNLFEEAPAAN